MYSLLRSPDRKAIANCVGAGNSINRRLRVSSETPRQLPLKAIVALAAAERSSVCAACMRGAPHFGNTAVSASASWVDSWANSSLCGRAPKKDDACSAILAERGISGKIEENSYISGGTATRILLCSSVSGPRSEQVLRTRAISGSGGSNLSKSSADLEKASNASVIDLELSATCDNERKLLSTSDTIDRKDSSCNSVLMAAC